jgi:4-oxalocrotonate tautomerase
MPHVIVKLWPKPEAQKRVLADAITQSVVQHLGYGEDAVSVSFQEIAPADWTEKVYQPDILNGPGTLYKKPGYGPS